MRTGLWRPGPRLSRRSRIVVWSVGHGGRLMVYETIDLVHRDGVSTVTLNRPPVNAVSPGLMQELLAALDELEAREATRCIVLRGSGTKAFSAGADLSSERPRAAGEADRFRVLGRRVVDRLEHIPRPVLAAVRGLWVWRGCALAVR